MARAPPEAWPRHADDLRRGKPIRLLDPNGRPADLRTMSFRRRARASVCEVTYMTSTGGMAPGSGPGERHR